MKKLFKISLLFFLIIGFNSCSDDDNDTLTGTENTGGLISVLTSNVVYDTQNSTSILYSVGLNAFQGAGVKVNSVDVYKQFTDVLTGNKSSKVFLKNVPFTASTESENVTFSFNYLDLVSGLTVNGVAVPTDDALINIGDKFTLSYVAKRTDGQDAANVKTTNVVAACVSDLGGTYSNVTTRLSPAGGPYSWSSEVVTEIGAAEYQTTNVGQYYAGGSNAGTGSTAALDPSATGIIFTEVCGKLFVAPQQLGQIYTNNVSQSSAQAALSSVDSVTGVMTLYYSIWFSGNTVERTFKSVYTPI